MIWPAGTSTVPSLLWLARSRFAFRALGWRRSECSSRCHTALDVVGFTSMWMVAPSSSRSLFRSATEHPFPPFSIYHLKTESLKGIGMGHYCRICGANGRTSSFPAKATEFMCASGARPCQRASGKSSRTFAFYFVVGKTELPTMRTHTWPRLPGTAPHWVFS